MTELSQEIAEMKPDDLIAGTQPPCRPGGAVVRKGAGKLKRGTLLAKSSVDAKLVVLGTEAAEKESLEPYGVLCDDIEVGSEEDLSVAIYISGKFNVNKITVANGYEITENDKDTLRKYSIELTAALSY